MGFFFPQGSFTQPQGSQGTQDVQRSFGTFGPFFPSPGGGPGQGPFFPFPGQQGPGMPPPPGFPGGSAGQQAPTAPPPQFEPQVAPFAVDPGGIVGCLFRNTFIWLNDGTRFWYFPTFVGRTSVAGFRWTGFSWIYFGIDLRRISSYTCF
ncbi:transporter [Paenibacillus chitinolyticus]|uniref:transporter n=1 Tax=Paenibacillus chitinolyticus TaxID=79263 RepID=UPI00365E6159